MPRRSTRKRGLEKNEDQQNLAPSDDDEVVGTNGASGSRRSNRSNKFVSSFKEPDNSIKDLLGGLSETISPAKKKKRRKEVSKKPKASNEDKEDDSDVENNDDEDDSNQEVDNDVQSDADDEDEHEDEEEDYEEESEDEKPVRRSTRTKTKPPSAASKPSNAVATPSAKRTRSSRSINNRKTCKSPAVRHSRARKKMKLEKVIETDTEDESESDQDSDDDSSVESDEDQPEVKIQRIIAVRMESKRKWREICSEINTSEIDSGSRWFQENLEKEDAGLDKFEERFLVKWSDLSFLHCSWERKDDLIDQVEGAKTYLGTFFRKNEHGYFYDADERMDGEYFDPSFIQIDRILEVNPPDDWEDVKMKVGKNGKRKKNENWGIIHDVNHPDYENGTGRVFLIKWGNTSYSDSTYEYERDLILMDIEYESHLKEFMDRRQKPSKSVMKKVFSSQEAEKRRLYKVFGDGVKDGEAKDERIQSYRKELEDFKFKNGGRLRDYQAEGVCWLLANYVNGRSAILADEMGLGKTIQTAAYVDLISTRLHARGPFLIVAPLSTIPHWQREFSGWTGLNTIVYHGSQKDREVIREFEFAYECDRPQGGVGINQKYLNKCHKRKATKAERIWMTQVIITTPEMLVTEDFNELTAVEWELLVVDEAHRLKSHSSKFSVNLRHDRFLFKHTLLLTGTPIQNNMSELWALMNVVDPDEFDDCDAFMEKYDNMQSKDRVDELHELIRPYILRRLKEDVEKSVPPKEETLIEVELTVLQKQYYRALYEKNVQFLHRDVKKALDGPSLNNLSMQLRKCCNHPFLLEGVEEKAKGAVKIQTNKDEADFLAKASGKLVLLDKLLPKLKDGGHKVLIFSQFKIMLDIIEDYLELRNFKQERIDGSITGKKRQMAIDRFQSKDSTVPSFIMLLSTRAGGVGINLTAADTCIIFDSDWNPQNDLQAQARCHRIGQTKSVKVYRLLTRKTYEMQMFHMSSLKMGLDQAVLQGIENGGSGNDGHNMTKEEVEKLLRHGAYDMFQEEQEGNAEKASNEFEAQDIDTILERRSKTVIHENTGSKSNASGGTFSKASFKTSTGPEMANGEETTNRDVDIDDPDFWKKMVGEAKAEHSDVLQSGKKRSRNEKVVYNENLFHQGLEETIVESDSSSSATGEESGDDSFEAEEEIEEFNFSVNIRNDQLKKLMLKRKEEILRIERKRWGGKTSSQWAVADVEVILRLLRRYGYGTGKQAWDFILDKFKSKASKNYDEMEVKRMSWSLCFIALQEAAEENVIDAARRAKRDAKKRESEESPRTSIPCLTDSNACDTNSEEWKNKQQILSFEKYRNASVWASTALEDAFHFAKSNDPRDIKQLRLDYPTDSIHRPLHEAFHENILPALINRGWKQQITKTRKAIIIGPKGVVYNSIAEVLDCLPAVHPELEGTVNSIISTLGNKVTDVTESDEGKDSVPLNEFTAQDVTFDQLSSFLQSYSPLQIIMDREHSRLINLVPQRLLNTLSYVHNARSFVTQSSGGNNEDINVRDYLKLSKLIDVSPKAAIPHPQWTSIHDAILVTAIAKHGWIDRDSHCRSIIEDKEIKWGSPFDESVSERQEPCPNKKDKQDSANVELIQKVAERAARFLNKENDAIKDCKGFNLNLILKSYSIVSSKRDDGTGISTAWEVDIEELRNTCNSRACTDKRTNGREEIEEVGLPTRKELLRRARILLARPPNNTVNSEARSGLSQPDFGVLDQSNLCNTFLAELLREAIKVGQKQQKWIDKVLVAAHEECRARSEECSSLADECAELRKISNNISLVKKNSKPFVRASKNVLRVIMGLEAHQNKPTESLFVEERKPKSVATATKTKKKSPKSSKIGKGKKKSSWLESTSGDAAVNRALTIGKYPDKNIAIPDEKYLKLTSIETLMLSVLCSQGMPVFDDNWHSSLKTYGNDDNSYSLCWFQTGSVLEAAAETWYSMTASRVAQAKENNNEIPRSLQVELEGRQLVYSEAATLRHDSISLARKAVMLMQALRIHAGSRLKGTNKRETKIGSRTLQWNSNHLVKWSTSLGIFINGKVLHNTVIGTKPNIVPTAYIDEKGCAAIYSQIVQQTRLRALYLKYNEEEFFVKMLPKALKVCDAKGKEWEQRPTWWGDDEGSPTGDDESLICGILQYGYGGFDEMVRQDERFSQYSSSDEKIDRTAGQTRLDSITRELGAIDDTSEALRLLDERKHNPASVTNENGDKNHLANSVQVGIDAFFVPKINRKKRASAVADSDDDRSVEIVHVNPGKRKPSATAHRISSPEKKSRS